MNHLLRAIHIVQLFNQSVCKKTTLMARSYTYVFIRTISHSTSGGGKRGVTPNLTCNGALICIAGVDQFRICEKGVEIQEVYVCVSAPVAALL